MIGSYTEFFTVSCGATRSLLCIHLQQGLFQQAVETISIGNNNGHTGIVSQPIVWLMQISSYRDLAQILPQSDQFRFYF